jgi:hypothetical protein
MKVALFTRKIVVKVALFYTKNRSESNTVKASMSEHRRSPIFCPFNRDVRSKEIYLIYVGRNIK